jgi:DNA ligase D-like protein (predicted ligase)
MLATLTEQRFDHPEWIFERKFDGVRCLAFRDGERTWLRSRKQQALEATYPELAEALAAQSMQHFVVDGEVVAFEGKRTSFERLQGRSGITDPKAARSRGIAAYYYIFDVLHADGSDIRRLPLLHRKRLLRAALDFADPLRFTQHRNEAGITAYERACARGDEGVIAKRGTSEYTAGRSSDWLKFKCVRDQELVVGGFTEPQGARTSLGALLVGYHSDGDLVYAGKVGTGFDTATLERLRQRLEPMEQSESPFTRGRVREPGARWVRPQLVAQIGFTEWTRDDRLRQPTFPRTAHRQEPRRRGPGVAVTCTERHLVERA